MPVKYLWKISLKSVLKLSKTQQNANDVPVFYDLLIHYDDVKWARYRLKSRASRLLTQPFIRAQIKVNIGEFPAQRASNAENVSIWWRHHALHRSIWWRHGMATIPTGPLWDECNNVDWFSLTHWGRDKMAAISQTTFSSGFSLLKMYEFRLRFYWSVFLMVKLTIFQHWFR